MAITNYELSKFRKKVCKVVSRIQHLSERSLFSDGLIKGTPGILYKKCGRPTCKCNLDDKNKHGPYKNIQIYKDNKQKLIPLKKCDEHYWDLAKRYQYQIEKLKELDEAHAELKTIIKEVISKRVVKFP